MPPVPSVDVAFEVLGPVRALVEGVEVGVAGQRRKALLALLIVHRNEVLPADRIAEAIWDGRPPGGALTTVQSHVSHLRRALGTAATVVVTHRPGYVLNVPPAAVDACRFEELAARARTAAGAGDHLSALADYDAALTLWRGDPLADLVGLEFAEREASRLEEVRISVIEAHVDTIFALGRHDSVVAPLEALVKAHPLRERLIGQLMLALYRAGRQADALRVFGQARCRLRDELGLEPGVALHELEGAILRHDSDLETSCVAGPGFAPSHSYEAMSAPAFSAWADPAFSGTDLTGGNLPQPAAAWFGPEAFLHRLASELPARRLLTVTGTGGIGKSRLALELASRASHAFADGAWIVELGPITDPGAVVMEVASTFCLQPQPGLTPAGATVDLLRDRNLLLVLDNCEHVLEPVASLVRDILARCPQVTILATSREPIVVAGERVLSVPVLATRDGVELFCDRATAVADAIEFSEADRHVIASICQRLDGIPLAIELAACRARSLSVAEILSRLDDRFRLLTGGRRGELEHHQTLRATLTWSYQLLSQPERELFERLSVFPGGFDLAAAESVCGDDTLDESRIIDLADSLVAKSMLVADRRQVGTRYRLLESLREYAQERRNERGDGSEIRHRHLDHYLSVGRAANDLCASPRQIDGDSTFDREWDNFRAAHGWAVAAGNAVAADEIVKLTGPHAFRRYRHEHRAWATQNLTLDIAAISPDATAHGWAAQWSFLGADLGQALDFARRGIDLARSSDSPDTTHCWSMVASVHLASGQGEKASTPAAQAMTAAGRGDPFLRASALSAVIESALSTNRSKVGQSVAQLRALARQVGAPSLLASASYHEGQEHLNGREDPDPRTAWHHFRHGLALATSVDDVFMEQLNLYGVVDAATALRAPEASRVGLDALTRFYGTRNWTGIWALLNVLAEWLVSEEKAEAAGVIYGHLEAHQHRPWDNQVVRQRRLNGLAAMSEYSYSRRWMARGAGLGRDALVTYVIAQLTHDAARTNDRARTATDR